MGTANHNFIGRVRIGPTMPALAAGEDMIVRVVGDDAANPQHLSLEYYNGSTNAPTQDFRKARGTTAAPADAQIGDRIIDIRSLARSTTFQFGGGLRTYVDGPGPLVAGQNAPTRLVLLTNLQNQAAREVVFVSSDGFVGISDGLFTATERPSAQLHILGEGGDIHLHVEKVSGDANPPLFEGFKARGTVAARANVVGPAGTAADGDVVLRLAGFARSTTYLDSAKIEFKVDAAVVAGQAPASRIEFYTNPNNTVPTLQGALISTGYMVYGSSAAALSPAGATFATFFPSDGHIWASDSGESPQHLYLQRASTTNGSNLTFRRQRGSFAVPANVVDGDRMIRIQGDAYSGATGYWPTGKIELHVDGAVVDNQRPGSIMDFFTNAPNGAVTKHLTLHNNGRLNVGRSTGLTAGGSTTAAVVFGSAQSLGVYFGSGAPTITAGKGSLYLRSDGSGTTNRAYINTDGGTTWTALTTVA